MMRNNGILAYLTYPYSDNPQKRTAEATAIARKIMKKHKNIFVIVPHTAVDLTLFGDAPKDVKEHKMEDHIIAVILEYTILSKIDMLILGHKLDWEISEGMCWEYGFVKWRIANGEKIKIVEAKDLIGEAKC